MQVQLTQISVVLYSGSIFLAGGVVKASNDHFILPRLGGDVIRDVTIDFLGHHAEDT